MCIYEDGQVLYRSTVQLHIRSYA